MIKISKIKIGVIGVENISECHISGYKNNRDVELYAFCDINAERLKAKGEKHGVTRLYTDLDKMLEELPELDAVSVCTWNNGHAECTIKALNAGKHVLCEKPMAMNAKEAQAMIDASKSAGKKLMVGFVRRFGNDTAVARDFIDAGSVGISTTQRFSIFAATDVPAAGSAISRARAAVLLSTSAFTLSTLRVILWADLCPSVPLAQPFREWGQEKILRIELNIGRAMIKCRFTTLRTLLQLS